MSARTLRSALVALALVSGAARAGAQPPDASTRPPAVRTRVEPSLPDGPRPAGRVELAVLVEASGEVSEVSVVASAGADIDRAVVDAVRKWVFEPATRDGQPVRSRIRVPFVIAARTAVPLAPPVSPTRQAARPPLAAKAPVPAQKRPAPPASPADAKADADVAPDEERESGGEPQVEEVEVAGVARKPSRAASDFRLDTSILGAAPRANAGDMLASAPGVYVAKPEGDAVAHRIYLRGFDADHGQDVELRVSGIPLNQSSHVHGQGYADLGIIVPEVVRRLRVVEGVYDPRQGDFAVAGSAEFDLGVEERGLLLKYGRGSFATDRFLAIWAPRGQAAETFGAVSVRSTDGFGPGLRGGLSGASNVQYKLRLGRAEHLLLHAAAYGARANVAGVLRRDDVSAGKVDFYSAYADPSARAQSAAASRVQVGVSFERRLAEQARVEAAVWFAQSDFRSRLNYTGYTQRSRIEPAWVGRGDLIEQSNADTTFGARASYRSPRPRILGLLRGQLEVGSEAKTSGIDQAQNLLRAPQNETWDQRVDAAARVTDIGVFADGLLSYKRLARLRGGLRADALFFDVDDRLGNFIPSFQKKTHIVGFRRTAAGVAWGPRATLELEPTRWLLGTVSYGEGFRSPQARQLEEGEQAPFAKVKSYEAGVTVNDEGLASGSVAVYETRLSYDLAFDPQEGRLERIGPTTRRGVVGVLRGKPTPFLDGMLSATFVDATLDSPPPPTPENPTPPYVSGQSLPYVPPLVLRQDVALHGRVFSLFDKDVTGRLGWGTTFLSPRPLPYGQSSAAVFLVDALASVRRDVVELSLEATNLLDTRWAQTELAYVSNWDPTGVPSRLPSRHLTAGPPRALLLSLTLHL
ncbi:MAG: TonB-dependent receptor [Polyangiaceae bacterium]